MKKFLSLMLALLLCLSLAACGSSKEEAKIEDTAPEAAPAEETPAAEPVEAATVDISVSISDAGVLRVANETVKVPDADGDGKVTADAVIAAAHDAFYEGGAAAGFVFEETEFGMSIIRLWGVENGGSYGYYVNNEYVLPDYQLVAGDYLCAYSYADLTGWSDCYAYFDQRNAEAKAGEDFSLKLSKLVYDENWQLQTAAAEGAKLLVNGEVTDFVTDAEGSVTLKLDAAGSYTVSAVGAEGETLVPPVCIVVVK